MNVNVRVSIKSEDEPSKTLILENSEYGFRLTLSGPNGSLMSQELKVMDLIMALRSFYPEVINLDKD